jgi:hypothetical protein
MPQDSRRMPRRAKTHRLEIANSLQGGRSYCNNVQRYGKEHKDNNLYKVFLPDN